MLCSPYGDIHYPPLYNDQDLTGVKLNVSVEATYHMNGFISFKLRPKPSGGMYLQVILTTLML